VVTIAAAAKPPVVVVVCESPPATSSAVVVIAIELPVVAIITAAEAYAAIAEVNRSDTSMGRVLAAAPITMASIRCMAKRIARRCSFSWSCNSLAGSPMAVTLSDRRFGRGSSLSDVGSGPRLSVVMRAGGPERGPAEDRADERGVWIRVIWRDNGAERQKTYSR
jgi:hypothetical protein